MLPRWYQASRSERAQKKNSQSSPCFLGSFPYLSVLCDNFSNNYLYHVVKPLLCAEESIPSRAGVQRDIGGFSPLCVCPVRVPFAVRKMTSSEWWTPKFPMFGNSRIRQIWAWTGFKKISSSNVNIGLKSVTPRVRTSPRRSLSMPVLPSSPP